MIVTYQHFQNYFLSFLQRIQNIFIKCLSNIDRKKNLKKKKLLHDIKVKHLTDIKYSKTKD